MKTAHPIHITATVILAAWLAAGLAAESAQARPYVIPKSDDPDVARAITCLEIPEIPNQLFFVPFQVGSFNFIFGPQEPPAGINGPPYFYDDHAGAVDALHAIGNVLWGHSERVGDFCTGQCPGIFQVPSKEQTFDPAVRVHADLALLLGQTTDPNNPPRIIFENSQLRTAQGKAGGPSSRNRRTNLPSFPDSRYLLSMRA